MNGHEHTEDFWGGIQNRAALDVAWPMIKHKIAELCEQNRGEFEPSDVYRLIVEKRVQLWIVNNYEGVCLTEVTEFPKMTSLNVLGFAGISLERGLKLLKEVLMPYAQERGACVIRDYAGRRGVVKQLIKEGWDTAYYVMELKL